MKESLLQKVFHFVFGYRYYGVVLNRRGTMEIVNSAFIFTSKKDITETFDESMTFRVIEVVSFWSRNKYVRVYNPNRDEMENRIES